jgi:predicted transposase YdaD
MATERFNYDVVVKDLFQKDRPSLLKQLAHGVEVRQFLNVELAVVEERVADLVVLLSDETILHLDFQSDNHRNMPFREGIYGLMVGQKYRRRIRQVVLYMGPKRMRMENHLDLGGIQVSYDLVDIRELDAASLLKSRNPGDYALALLSGGGIERLREIIRKANALPAPHRQRALTQMAILSGLRGASERLTMELKAMGISVDIDQNVFLKDIRDSAKAVGMAEGRVEGMVAIVREQMETRFGPLPKWARERLAKASPAQAERWAKKVLTAATVEGVLGKRT